MLVVNLFGGAGCGKSTTAATLFTELKRRGYNVELVGEYAKDLVYDKAYSILNDQLYVFAEQSHRLRRLDKAGVKIAVCDSPLLLSFVYGKESGLFGAFVIEEHWNYRNENFVLERNDNFWKPDGRLGNIDDAKKIDSRILETLELSEDTYTKISPNNIDEMLNIIERTYNATKI